MIKYDGSNFTDIDKPGTIYTLDIETTSLFKDPDTREWQVFDYSKPPEYYQGCLKVGIPYIWMIGVNDTVYYGTEFSDIELILLKIAGPKKKILWIHNSAWEFQFMRDFLEHYHIDRMIARSVRKPIAYTIRELNIQVRCTYMLTNLSLAKAAERYTDIRKKSGDLDYNIARHPGTVQYMSETELSYCEYDILTLYKIVLYFKRKYKQLSWIPYTQTGEVRKEFRKRVNFHYVCKIRKKVPSDQIYLILQKAFQGGMTHGNALYIGQIIEDVLSFDIASSYPTTFLFKFPVGKFRKILPETAVKMDPEKYAIIYHVKFHNVSPAKLNKYILNSKIISGSGIYADNGRLIEAKEIEMYLTEVDYNIITQEAYNMDKPEVLEAWYSIKGYLPKELIMFALELYNDKTRLKGVEGQEDFYMKQKQMLNSLFGCACTNILKSGVTYDTDPETGLQEWKLPELTLQYVHDKLEGLRNSKSNCFVYAWGCWITAYARQRLWRVISKLDTKVIYYDTDSVKVRNSQDVFEVIEEENRWVREKLEKACGDLEIDTALLSPEDPKGVQHPLGLWENEEKNRAKYFITQGAKRYAYQTYDNQLHCVVSGVNNKTGYKALNGDLSNFKHNLVFEYSSAGKLISHYNDDQPEVTFQDYLGNWYTSHQHHGIALQPAEYDMNLGGYYAYVEEKTNGFKNGGWIK